MLCRRICGTLVYHSSVINLSNKCICFFQTLTTINFLPVKIYQQFISLTHFLYPHRSRSTLWFIIYTLKFSDLIIQISIFEIIFLLFLVFLGFFFFFLLKHHYIELKQFIPCSDVLLKNRVKGDNRRILQKIICSFSLKNKMKQF